MKDLKFDFGAVGDDTADDTAAVQAALDWVTANRDELFIPRGFYRISSQLIARQGVSFRVFGPSKQGANWHTALRWAGPAGDTMLLLDGCRDSEWTDFAIDAVSAANEPGILVDIDKVTAGSWNSRKNSFRRMILRGGSVATVRISHVTALNNEANLFEDVENVCVGGSFWVPGTTTGPVGYLTQNVNAKSQQIVRGEISGKECAVFNQDGSAHVSGVQIGGCGTWLRHGGRGEPCVIEKCDGDSSRTFIECMLTQTAPVTAIGNRFFPHYPGPLLLLGDTVGPLTMIGNEFANGGYKTPADSFVQITSNGPNLLAFGNTFPNEQCLPIPGTNPPKLRSLYALGNMFYGPGHTRNLMNDYLVPNRSTGQSVTSLQIGGSSGFVAETQSLGGGATINSNQAIAPVTTTSAITLSLLPSIRPGNFNGQRLQVTNIGQFNLSLIDRTTLAGTGVALSTPTVTLPPKASVEFMWTVNGSFWIQTSPVVAAL
jgi:hypothetical protein